MHVLEAAKYPYVSPSKVFLHDDVDLSGRAKYPLVKVHGELVLMMGECEKLNLWNTRLNTKLYIFTFF